MSRPRAGSSWRGCAAAVALAAGLGLGAPSAAAAQWPAPWEGPRWWIGAWFGGMFPGSVDDPDTGTWNFGDNVAGGLEAGWQVGPGAFLVGDLSYTRTGYDRVDGPSRTSGDADILATVAGFRYSLFRGPAILYSPFGILGLGAVHYRLSDVGEFDTDFSLLTGGGLDLRLARSARLTLGVYEYLVFHQRPDTRSQANLSRITELRLGLRWGL